MKKTLKIILIMLLCVVSISCIVYFAFYHNNEESENISNIPISSFVPSLTNTNIEEITKNTTKNIEESSEDISIYEIDGKYDDFDGKYEYTVDKENSVNVQFSIEAINVWPNEPDENGVVSTDEEALKDGYTNVQKIIDKFNNKEKYKINRIYQLMTDGSIIYLDSIPTAEQLKNEYVNSETISCYVVNITKTNGETISVSIQTTGWYSVFFIILNNE